MSSSHSGYRKLVIQIYRDRSTRAQIVPTSLHLCQTPGRYEPRSYTSTNTATGCCINWPLFYQLLLFVVFFSFLIHPLNVLPTNQPIAQPLSFIILSSKFAINADRFWFFHRLLMLSIYFISMGCFILFKHFWLLVSICRLHNPSP